MDQQILAVVEECVTRLGAHVIDLLRRGDRGRLVLEVYVDSEEGVTTELCAGISREITASLDAGRIIARDYRLEVSSPGIERPLRYPWQYRKHLGRTLQVKVKGAQGVEQITGTFIGLEEHAVRLETARGAEPLIVPIKDILEAKVPAPW